MPQIKDKRLKSQVSLKEKDISKIVMKHKSVNKRTAKRLFFVLELNKVSLTQKDTVDGRT